MSWGCQAEVETAILTTMNTKTTPNFTETCESIKLGIDTYGKWDYVAGISMVPRRNRSDLKLFFQRFEDVFKSGQGNCFRNPMNLLAICNA